MTGPDRPIFLLGCPRSGTTMLQLMLHRHPRIAIPPETRFVVTGYQGRSQFGDLTDPVNRQKLAQWIVGRKASRFHELGLNKKAVAEQIENGPPTLGSAFGIVFKAYAERFDKPRWGDKRPGYSRYVDDLLRLFPDAQIVHLVRDGRDCVASLLEVPWWKKGPYAAICTWAQTIDDMQRAKRTLPADTFYELRYEDLVLDPEGSLRSLCAFLGEDYDPAMTAPEEIADTAVPERKHWHQRTHEQVNAARVATWSSRLSPATIALSERTLGARLQLYGYELSGAGRPAASDRLRHAQVCARRRLSVRKTRLLERWQRMRERRPVAAQLTSGQQAAIRSASAR